MTTATIPSPLDGLSRMLSLAEVAACLRVSRRTVDRLISAGTLPMPLKVGRSCRMPAEDVQAYLDQLKAKRR